MNNLNHNAFVVTPFSRDANGSIWSQFAKASTAEEFCRLWLSIQCSMLENVKGALILLGKANEGPYTPVAVWPDAKKNMQYLAPIAEKALGERQGFVIEPADSDTAQGNHRHIAYPIEVNGILHGVVVIDALVSPSMQTQAIHRQLHWGMAWLELLFLKKDTSKENSLKKQLFAIFDLIATSVEKNGFTDGANAFVTEMATHFKAERVSLGFLEKKTVRLKAISNTAEFGPKMNLPKSICEAMEEAIDQRSLVAYPGSLDELTVSRSHQKLSDISDKGAVFSIPFSHGQDMVGCLTLEFGKAHSIDQAGIELCDSLIGLVGPILHIQYQEERWLFIKFLESGRRLLTKLMGPRHFGLKLICFLVAFLLVFFSLATDEYRVTGKASIEGVIQRSIVAPFNAYIKEANARAGDIVRKGDTIVVLEDEDFILERAKIVSEKGQLEKKYREVLAHHELAQIRILKAQIGKNAAQLALIESQMARTQISTPFEGVVISGDLSQALGAPVEQGQVLFEVAPLNSYRIMLDVDEHDIRDVVVGQEGRLVLTALPNETLPFTVVKVTPVTIAEEGKNYFSVEAQPSIALPRLRPGMEGVGKISIDRRKLIWIWTHKSIEWVRLWVWSWWP